MVKVESCTTFKKLISGLNNIEYDEWSEFQRKMFLVIDIKYKKKFYSPNNKLKRLLSKTSPQELVNIVENHSSQSFTRNEMIILNSGLNFAVAPSRDNLTEIVAHFQKIVNPLLEKHVAIKY